MSDKSLGLPQFGAANRQTRQSQERLTFKASHTDIQQSFLEQLINSRLGKSKITHRIESAADRLLKSALTTDFSNPHVDFIYKRSSR